jgi:hypothetical protein
MPEIIYKPQSAISVEWESLCEQHHKALNNLYKIHSIPTGEYPSEQWWNKLESAQIEYDKIRTKMDHYRKTVKISN